MQLFGALVDEVYADKDFAEPLFEVPTVNPERTFLEKIFQQAKSVRLFKMVISFI